VKPGIIVMSELRGPLVERVLELQRRFDPRMAAELPPHHRDPFDRVLIAQALSEGLTIVTSDSAFDPYGVQVTW